MQIANKDSMKRIFAHTWYLYPISGILLSLLLLWAFYAYHQPSRHQQIEIFFACDAKDESFIKEIQNKYEREKLREVIPSYCLPTAPGFANKLQIAINSADLIVLNEPMLEKFNSKDSIYFYEFNSYAKAYFPENTVYYPNEEKDYAFLLKSAEDNAKMNKYLTFVENENYYLCLAKASKNVGTLISEDNSYYDNALTFASYLLEL